MRQKTILFSAFIPALLCLCGTAQAQRFLSDYDSSLFLHDTLVTTVRRFENLNISGYMQPQYQVAGAEGTTSYEGGNFGEHVSQRFLLRRARIKIDYIVPAKDAHGFPQALFTFQFEATERDLNIRDMFVRLYEPDKKNFSLTAGLFSRPFGYEVNLSSSFREAPERGRMSQILMPSERDLGAMVSYDPPRRKNGLPRIKFDLGFFNGQGKSGPAEFDNYKDLISRLVFKPFNLSKKLTLGLGLSLLNGGWRQQTAYRYTTATVNGQPLFVVDSTPGNLGGKAPRRYYGADAQLVLRHRWGKTEWRAEYWRGTQSGTLTTTVNPGTLPQGPTYIRRFDGGFFYFLQNLGNEKWELVAKYDWYDPNRGVAGLNVDSRSGNFSTADVAYGTAGIGLTRYINSQVKILAYHAFVRNEHTALAGYAADVPDDVFTLRLQLRF